MGQTSADLLKQALGSSEAGLRKGLEGAIAEREMLAARLLELDLLIERANAALGNGGDEGGGDHTPLRLDRSHETDRLTLHEAMAIVLKEMGGTAKARAIADEINRRKLYRKRDGSPVEVNQIYARANNYSSLFKSGSDGITLLK